MTVEDRHPVNHLWDCEMLGWIQTSEPISGGSGLYVGP